MRAMWGRILLAVALMWPGGGGPIEVACTKQCTPPGNQTRPTALPLRNPGDGIMHWVYDLSKVFMEDVIITENWLETFPDDNAVNDELLKRLLQHFQGYIIVSVVGIAFIILLPIAGCCFCCCRTCCCCCKKRTSKSDLKSKACGGCFFVFVALLTLGIGFAITAAGFVSAQFEKDGMVHTLSQSIQGWDRFTNGTAESLWVLKDNTIDPSLTNIRKKVTDLPTATHHDLGEETGAAPLYTNLEEYTKNLNKSVAHFENMKVQTSALITQCTDLEVKLDNLKNNMDSDLKGCPEEACENVLNRSMALGVLVNFSGVSDTQPAINNMTVSLTGKSNITASVDIGTKTWSGVGEVITNASQASTQNINKTIINLSTEIENIIEQAAGAIKKIHSGGLGDDIGEELGKFSPYILYALLALCSVPLLVAVCYILGMMFGFIGKPPGKERFCSTGKGACCLMCGVSFTFLLAWLIMGVVTILFLVGSTMHNEVCRPLVNPFESEDLQFVFEQLSKELTGSSTKLDILDTLKGCQENDALYTALHIDELFPDLNITKLLDLSQLNFDDLLDDLTNVNLTTGHVVLMNNVTKRHLVELNKGYETVDFKTYHDALQKDITNEDLALFADFLSHKANDILNSTFRDKVVDYSRLVRSLHSNEIHDVKLNMVHLKMSTESAESFVNSLNSTMFIPEMDAAQSKLNNHAIQTSLRTVATAIFGDIDGLTTKMDSAVRCDIGQCQELTNILSGVVTVFCVHLLYPLNAFWFGLGWCLIVMVIPLLMVAVSLTDQWRVSSVEPIGDDAEMGGYGNSYYKLPPRNRVYPTKKKSS